MWLHNFEIISVFYLVARLAVAGETAICFAQYILLINLFIYLLVGWSMPKISGQ